MLADTLQKVVSWHKTGYVEKVKPYDVDTWKEKGSISNWFDKLEISLGSSWFLDVLFLWVIVFCDQKFEAPNWDFYE